MVIHGRPKCSPQTGDGGNIQLAQASSVPRQSVIFSWIFSIRGCCSISTCLCIVICAIWTPCDSVGGRNAERSLPFSVFSLQGKSSSFFMGLDSTLSHRSCSDYTIWNWILICCKNTCHSGTFSTGFSRVCWVKLVGQ